MIVDLLDENDFPKGYLEGCYLSKRVGAKDDPMFFSKDGTIVAQLEDYAIIPMEEYNILKSSLFRRK